MPDFDPDPPFEPQSALSHLQTMIASLGLSVVGMLTSSEPLNDAEVLFTNGYQELFSQLSRVIEAGGVYQVDLYPSQLPLLRASLTGSLAYTREYPQELIDIPDFQDALTTERLEATLAQVNDWIAQPVPVIA